MDLLTDNLAETLVVIGLALLAIEIVVLGFSTFVLFFVGVAAVFSGFLMYIGLIPDTMLNALLSVGIFTAVTAFFAWKPLRNMQNDVESKHVEGGLVGHSFVLDDDVSPSQNPNYRYSGIEWKLTSEEEIKAGTEVEVAQADVGVFHIKVKSDN